MLTPSGELLTSPGPRLASEPRSLGGYLMKPELRTAGAEREVLVPSRSAQGQAGGSAASRPAAALRRALGDTQTSVPLEAIIRAHPLGRALVILLPNSSA